MLPLNFYPGRFGTRHGVKLLHTNSGPSPAPVFKANCADPSDVCAAVRYLLSAAAVTGEMIAVDGGQHLIWKTPDVSVQE